MCDNNAAMIIRASKYMPRLYAYITHLDLWLSWVHNKSILHQNKMWIHFQVKKEIFKDTKESRFSLYVQVEISKRPLLTELLISLHAVTCYMIPSREWAMIIPSW